MNPHSLYLRNVRTFDEIRLDLPEGLLAVIGSNGAGKSTLISAIDIALFGPEGRSLAPWYPRGLGSDPLTIELVFEHAGEFYRVRRSFSPKGRGMSKFDLERSMAGDWVGHSSLGDVPDAQGNFSYARESVWEPLTLESQTATQDMVEKIIGLSRATFRASSYLAQGDAGAFCDAAPGSRKAILAEVVGLAEWDGYLERARAERKIWERALAEARTLLERASDELTQREALTYERADAAESEEALQRQLHVTLSALAAARERLTEARRQAERRAALERAQKAAERARADELRRIASLEAEMSQLAARLQERDDLTARAGMIESLEEEQEAIQDQAEQWRRVEQIGRELLTVEKRRQDHFDLGERLNRQADAVLRGIGEERCDRCNQVLGEDAARRASVSYREEAAANLAEVAELDRQWDELIRLREQMPREGPDEKQAGIVAQALRGARQAAVDLAALTEMERRGEAANQELSAARDREAELLAAFSAASAEVEALDDSEAVADPSVEIRALEAHERNLRGELDATARRLARCDEALERLDRIERDAAEQREREELTLRELELAGALERACGPNGIPALILENVAIPQVEVEATRLLRILGGPATGVELRTQRETKTGGVSDTLDIVLSTETGDATYETFSGGERARIAFSLRLALAQLLSARKGADTGLLVIDEIDGLDAAGVAALVGVLEEMQQAVPRIIVVSHQAELRDAFTQSLVLENIDGRSRIVEGVSSVGLEVS